MADTIKVEVIEGFCDYNQDGTTLICDVNVGEMLTANLNKVTGEYFGKDIHGRKVFVGILGESGNVELTRGFELRGL